ncbi:TPA: hypothetical protein R4350_000399 [Pasteurella multocida]|uniref:hypothetical protein n=2 Tax=Pasteurella multocida TaxID=747 RepID=UPI00202234FA|nr:hypothetical protein [Pasteurella multocida]MCL7819232.1 hypothetical protein [Pasteurella multocida]URJ97279.1 hypothetical protein M9413_10990 [Pasteurella multocida]HDR1043313.1 hypothetical protein [Pasteurella multocida]HDR1108571.1 hypothetical protein [Pasteurella multocida]HDR1223223.1 hypothetical protein [Pasteurella multocida]
MLSLSTTKPLLYTTNQSAIMVDYVIHRNPNLCLIPTQSDTTNPNNPSDYLLIAHWLMVDYCLVPGTA